MLIGLRDLNADFNALEGTKPFVNSAFGITPALSQTGPNGPSIFPTTALAVSLKYESPSSFYFESAVFGAKAGDPLRPEGTHVDLAAEKGALMIWEAGVSRGESDRPFKYAVGAWTYSEKKDATDPEKGTAKNGGYYAMFGHQVTGHLDLFAKYGSASGLVNMFGSSGEAGVVYRNLTGLFPSDALIFGWARAWATEDYRLMNDAEATETVAEIAYRMEVGRGVAVTPDFQYVTHPGLSKELKNATVGSLRFEVSF